MGEGAGHQAGRVTATWSLRALLAAALLLPLCAAGLLAWRDHQRTLAEAEGELRRVGALAGEHALKVVETANLVLDRINEVLQGQDWPELRADAPRVQRLVTQLDSRIEHLRVLHIIEPDGTLFAVSRSFPAPQLNLAGRDYFRRHAAGYNGTFYGEPLVGRTTGQLAFTVSRPRLTADGAFDGVVMGSIRPGYFHEHWAAMGSGRGHLALFRDDGLVLTRWSGLPGAASTPALPAVAPIGTEPATRVALRDAEGGEWLATVRRIGREPLFIAYALPRSAVLAQWWRHVFINGAIALAVSLTLFVGASFAWRRWSAEARMLAELQASSAALREQVARREAAEEKLAQAQRLEAMGRLTGGIAHDFNNLLTAVLGTVTLLERHLGAAADERSRRLLAAARDAVARGSRLNASLLAFARRQPLKREALDVNALLRGFEPLLARAIGDAVALRLQLAAAVPPCEADSAQLEAALLNLAINARDATPAGGEVRIATRAAWLGPAELASNDDARPGAFAEVTVTDSGAGMPPEVQARAFEPFFTTKAPGKGTGLGLSQVFGFVRQLGGHVAIRSAPGQGTAVSLYLPLSEAAAMAPPAEPARARSTVVAMASATVLVAEDDGEVREVAAELLREAGFRVLAAADGREALALLGRGERVDVLFSDVVMPGGISGLDLARRAREMRPDIAVLLASGYAMPALGSAVPEFQLLPKPYDRDTVVASIAAQLRERRQGVA